MPAYHRPRLLPVRNPPPPPPTRINPNPKPLMLFVPRQVVLESRAAAAAAMAKEEVKKEKKEKKRNSKTESSSTLETLAASDPKGKEATKGKRLLVNSIAAFLEANGFSRTLAALLSEAPLEVDVWKSSSVRLEDLFGKFLESSNCPAEAGIDGSKEQGQGKGINDSSEETHKKKKKGGAGAEINETEKEASEPSTVKTPSEDGQAAIVPHHETKEKKQKKKSSSLAGNAENDQTNEREQNDDQHLQLPNPNDDNKKKKGKKKQMDNAEDVALQLEKAKLALKNSYEAVEKRKEDRKKPAKEIENYTESQSAEKSGLGNIAPQDEGKKKKKEKSTSEKPSSGTSDKTGAGTSLDEVGRNSDSTQEKTHAVETGKDDTQKKSKKKRKKSGSEENVLQEGKEIASKDSVAKSDHENKEGMEISKADESRPDSENIVVGKKRKLEEIEGSTCTAEENLLGRDQSNNTADQKLDNGLAEDDTKERSTISKPSKRQKHSSEPKTVNAFQRVKLDEVKFVDERLQDNSYWAKSGADTGYGAKAQEVLGQVRGRGFRHEKTKKKRGSYRGGQIDLQTHSIKFNDSDDE